MAGGKQVELKEVSTVATKTWQWTNGGLEVCKSHISQRAIVQRLNSPIYASFTIKHWSDSYWKDDGIVPNPPDFVQAEIPIRKIQFVSEAGDVVEGVIKRLDEKIAQLKDLRDGLAAEPCGPLADLLTGGWEKIKAGRS